MAEGESSSGNSIGALEYHPSGGESETSKVSLDSLGPVIVNGDGTISRITNWQEMSEAEKIRTARIVAKRNEKRLGRGSNLD